MSLIGFTFSITDTATALYYMSRIVLYRSDLPLSLIHVELVKPLVREIICSLDPWWSSRIYMKIKINLEREDVLLKQYKCHRFFEGKREKKEILVDLAALTGEPTTRFSRAKELICSVDQIYFTENAYSTSNLYHIA